MARCKDDLAREFRLRATARFGWTKAVLRHQIDNESYEKYLLNQTNFDQAQHRLLDPTAIRLARTRLGGCDSAAAATAARRSPRGRSRWTSVWPVLDRLPDRPSQASRTPIPAAFKYALAVSRWDACLRFDAP